MTQTQKLRGTGIPGMSAEQLKARAATQMANGTAVYSDASHKKAAATQMANGTGVFSAAAAQARTATQQANGTAVHSNGGEEVWRVAGEVQRAEVRRAVRDLQRGAPARAPEAQWSGEVSRERRVVELPGGPCKPWGM